MIFGVVFVFLIVCLVKFIIWFIELLIVKVKFFNVKYCVSFEFKKCKFVVNLFVDDNVIFVVLFCCINWWFCLFCCNWIKCLNSVGFLILCSWVNNLWWWVLL